MAETLRARPVGVDSVIDVEGGEQPSEVEGKEEKIQRKERTAAGRQLIMGIILTLLAGSGFVLLTFEPQIHSLEEKILREYGLHNEEKGGGDSFSDTILNKLYIPTLDYNTKRKHGIYRLIVSQENPEQGFIGKEVMDGIFSKLPAQDIKKRFDTCAVVGNSGVLARAKRGNFIDKHEAVFRFNDAPTRKLEDIAGRKTHYRFLNNRWAQRLLSTQHEPHGIAKEDVVILAGKSPSLKYPDLLELSSSSSSASLDFYMMAPEFFNKARRQYIIAYDEFASKREAEGKPPYKEDAHKMQFPSGILGIYVAMGLCRKIRVFGFSRGGRGEGGEAEVPYTYYKEESEENRKMGQRAAFDFQEEFLRMLSSSSSTSSGRLVLCIDDKSPVECDRI